ncbi:MAG: glycerate kinase [Dermatophilaceae bacterium]
MRIVVAPDSFKGCLSAGEVAEAIRLGAHQASPDAVVVCRPMADGGEGTTEILTGSAEYHTETLQTTDSAGRPVSARYARHGRRLVLDLAAASGLPHVQGGGTLIASANPLTASTAGTGRLICHALEAGVDDITLCLGGSATIDGGTGLLAELGVAFRDVRGDPLPPGGGALADLDRIDTSGLLPAASAARWTLLCDVTNPLVGPRGAARVFGPQKGADPDAVARLDRGLRRLAEVLAEGGHGGLADRPGAGAAGGTPATLLALVGAELVWGAAHVATAIGLADALAGADLVITGEGRVDDQSVHGKVVGTVTDLAASAGAPTIVIAGQVDLTPDARRQLGAAAVVSIATGPATIGDLRRDAAGLVAAAARETVGLAASIRAGRRDIRSRQ